MIVLLLLSFAIVIYVVAIISVEIANLRKIFTQAAAIESQDSGNPLELARLQKSLRLYSQCQRLVDKSRWLRIALNLKIVDRHRYLSASKRVQTEIDRRHHFQRLLTQAERAIKDKYFEMALATLLKADELYSIERTQVAIIQCEAHTLGEQQYRSSLQQAHLLASKGQFQPAFDLITAALIKFERADGVKLHHKIQRVLATKQKFAIGLELEHQGELANAKNYYQQVIELTPEFSECRIRLAIIAIKTDQPDAVISYLEHLHDERAAYLRGYAYVMQNNWRQADREWHSLSHLELKSQRQSLKILAQRDRLLTIQNIQHSVDAGDLDRAKEISLQFIAKFGVDPVIENNLSGHIQPLLETKVWQTQDWQLIATTAEKFWLEHQDIKSLHNWAIASYYQAQIDPDRIADLIIVWSSAIANLENDPVLQDVPWLENTPPNLERIYLNLAELLEKLIDTIKDKDLDRYLQLRDLYRWQTVAFKLTKDRLHTGIRIKQLLLLPGCYQRHFNILPQSDLPAEPWGRLYTDRGSTVAACIEGDLARALQIQPQSTSISVAEKSADSFITYHQGCYYLQQQQWRQSIIPFQQVKAEIKNFPDWIGEIDRLCEKQRQEINDFDEHLEFAQFWYDLAASKPARSYLAEYKALQVGSELAEDLITLSQGLKQLQQIEKIDNANPVVIDLINKIEVVREINSICALMKENRMAEGVRRAKYSSHQQVKYRIAEILIDILVEGSKSQKMSRDEIFQLGSWAQEICPYEANFMEVYQSLGLCK